MASEAFEPRFAEVAARHGGAVDPSDEHARLAVYRAVLTEDGQRSALLGCLADEPDVSLATSMLAELLEIMQPSERGAALSVAPPSGSDFLSQRAQELELLERAGRPSVDDEVIELVLAGSDWLQRRVAVDAQAAAMRSALADRGRTRKVRTRAARSGAAEA